VEYCAYKKVLRGIISQNEVSRSIFCTQEVARGIFCEEEGVKMHMLRTRMCPEQYFALKKVLRYVFAHIPRNTKKFSATSVGT